MSGSRDNSNKVHVVHIVLSIVVMWHNVDEFTLENYFLFKKKKRKRKKY